MVDAIPGAETSIELRPGLVLADGVPEAPRHVQVSTDVAAFVRVRRSPVPLPDEASTLWISDLPGSSGGVDLPYVVRHHALTGWDEQPFAGEFRTRQPATVRQFFHNGGGEAHLLDLLFYVPPFDPEALPANLDPEDVAEDREEEAFLAMYDWALERLDDYGEEGGINQLALPELWTAHPHLLPRVWARVAASCRLRGNRFCVADAAPPLRVLQDDERRRARAEGVVLSDDELSPEALVPWYRADFWERQEDIPVEVALTLDAVREARLLAADEVTLSFLALYWPWLKTGRGLDVPPCGSVLGIYSRSDREHEPVGVMKPPANEPVKAIADLALHIDERPTNRLRRAGANFIDLRAGKGIVVWGARTLSDEDLWRFVNVRRLIGFIGKQIELDNQWSVFENNDEDLRQRVARDTRYFLTGLWERGALRGATPDEAFRVNCSEENNPSHVVERGMLVVDVWVNPVQTNEFVHLQLAYGDALTEE